MVQLVSAHDILCDCVDLRNEAFTVQFLLNLTNSISALLFCTFNIANMFMTNTLDASETITSIVYLAFSVFYLYFISLLVVCAALVKFEGNKSAGYLQKSTQFDGGCVAMVNTYNLQLQHRSAQISSGFFECDLTLFYTVSLFN